MQSAIEGLKPEPVWRYFAEISRIPRGSKNEAAVAQYVMDTAKRLGLEAKQDASGNVLVKKPASPGRESVPSVALQGHLDMVCEKNADKDHDFMKDPIELVRKDRVLMANGTTLGADNGTGVATALAIMEDRSLVHGPLEFLFTVDEETGLTGAANLEPGFLDSRILLNLDTEEEGALYIGCSGGVDTLGTWKADYKDAPSGHVTAQLKVAGLRGGHSGLDIDKGRGNAIKILTRVLLALDALGARIASVSAGSKHNAIPREADAVVLIPKKMIDEATNTVQQLATTLRAEVATVDPDLVVSLEKVKGKRKAAVLKKGLQRKLLQTLSAMPHGVVKMSAEISGLVETSTNLAVINTTKKSISMVTSQRSSAASEIQEIAQTVASVLELGGAEIGSTHSYPGWKPNPDSAIVKLSRSTYASMYGREPLVKAVHAGLECGLLGEKYPAMDMVSIGPTLEAVHSPDEKIYIDTVEKFWNFLLAVLRNVG
ncbi:MAG: aminoacyl-histidine dipeptidase [Acidobacteriota bacterium]